MMVLLSKELKLPFISRSRESTAARTAIMENIPMVTPNKDRKVRSLLFINALTAKLKLSVNSLKYISIEKPGVFTKIKDKTSSVYFRYIFFKEIKL
jgi:hypothetical protein